ncbi:hypothetical protein CDL12_12966 [Handroanthus impetiginosus]|uniref:Uncharacterized protein n=1 Tax=Handroanthus impetiginosus TaxID=429701 RepID=A0A2G9HA51_9LAMI|nr:hypothetical protein CDL12_12966 [Handroanthus impetiginosus]
MLGPGNFCVVSVLAISDRQTEPLKIPEWCLLEASSRLCFNLLREQPALKFQTLHNECNVLYTINLLETFVDDIISRRCLIHEYCMFGLCRGCNLFRIMKKVISNYHSIILNSYKFTPNSRNWDVVFFRRF